MNTRCVCRFLIGEKKIEKQDEAKERKEKAAKLLARGTKEKPTELGACFSLLEGASAEFGEKVDRKVWWGEAYRACGDVGVRRLGYGEGACGA